MASSAAEHGALVGAFLLLTAAVVGQDELVLRAAFGDRASRLTVPAVEWLLGECLPRRPEWPAGLDANEPFAIALSARGLEITPTRVALPDGVVAAGSCSAGAGQPMVWSCSTDGVEDWFVPRDFEAPPGFRSLLGELQADLLDEPRTIDAAVVIGHLAGVAVDGDPRSELLRVGSSLCGQVAWTAWSTPTHVRVRGRSNGGLLLPAVLLMQATGRQPAAERALALRAFAGRDGDRAEAARQFARAQAPQAVATLRALLRADDVTALAAIDALVRLRCADELPRIVAAARPESPWAALAAADALRALWIDASPAVRAATRKAVADCRSLTVRAVDLDRLPKRIAAPLSEAPVPDGSSRAQALLLLTVFSIGLYGLWARERARLRAAAA